MDNAAQHRLVKASQNGDLDAYGVLVDSCREDILKDLTYLMGYPCDAEDVLQDAILRGYLKLSSLRAPYNFGGWLRSIARNMAMNRLSRGRKHIPLEEHLTESESSVAVDEGFDNDPRRIPALAALSELSPKLRETARLTYLRGLSLKQTSHRLGVPLGTVKRRLWTGRARMKEEVLNMQEKNAPTGTNMVPEIRIEELPNERMTVETAGPGLYFGTTLDVGHSEVCSFFDYPGGILTQSVQTQVVRKVSILGEECFEVLIRHSQCQPPVPNILDYFQPTEDGFRWVMRTVADTEYPSTEFKKADEEIFPGSYSSGEHGDYVARVANLSIGETKYGRCLAVFWSWENGTPAESFYTSEGRQVLHRRYVGPDAPESSHYNHDELLQEERRTFRGTEYRIWYDTVLSE